MELAAADTEMLERVCETDSDHWVGRASDTLSSAVDVAPDVLATYVGVYSRFWATLPRKVEVALSGGQLVAIIDDDGRPVRLVPLSDTLFESSDGLGYRFVRNGGGQATHVVEVHVSGDYQYDRRR